MFAISALIIAAILTLWALRNRGYADPRWWWASWIIAALCLALAVLFFPNWLTLSKIIGLFLMPLGWCWILLGLGGIWGRGNLRRLSLSGFVLIGLAGNLWIGTTLLNILEAPYRDIDPLSAGPFDAVVVLGGGSNTPSPWRSQVGASGDRIVLGAQLAIAKRTAILVTTGSTNDYDHSEETANIWSALGIAESQMVRLPELTHTAAEIQAVKKLVHDRGWKRVGLVTSAWHMRRAMALAERHELQLTPLPADFRGHYLPPESIYLIPQDKGLAAMETALWEMLGTLAGR